MEKHIIDYLRTSEYRSWGVLSVLQYLSVNIKYTNDNIEEISRILQQQLDVTLQDPNIFKLARDKAKKISEHLALDINKPEVQDFLSEQEEEEIPAQEVQPFQDKPELSQELSPLPYTLYENDTHYTIIIYTPSIISKNQLTIGVENKLLVIEGSSYINDESSKYGKIIKNSWPLGLNLKILLLTK
ncbi:unnamed protein product [Rhizophagus irregularis]|nr:unnamed protein product [Rhizophagus irregularis]CAB5364579.1 unnamed protein product [Rhizophagus irregularis]